jgi:hypothetical protein
MVNFEDELAFGIEQEPNKWISKTADWMQVWQSNPSEDAFAILTNQKYHDLEKQGFPMQLVGRDDLRVIVRKPLQ